MRILGMRKVGKLELAVLLLLLGGGAFLYWAMGLPDKKETFNLEPTRWSQAEDYEIREENGRIVVQNHRAGFVFAVPEGWGTEKQNSTYDEFWIALRSPDAKYDQNSTLRGGCGIDVAFIDHPDTLNVDMIRGRMKDLFDHQKIVKLNSYNGIQTTDRPDTEEQRIKYGTNIIIEVPLNNEDILSIGTLFYQGDCSTPLQEFLSSFQID